MINSLQLPIIAAIMFSAVYSQVELELSVVHYNNPFGTSYKGDNTSSDRKCCDKGGNSCSTGNDTCDVYFLFCIGRNSLDPSAPGCNGSSIDMSKDVSHDVYSINRTDKMLLKYGNMSWWSQSMTDILVKVLDIDVHHGRQTTDSVDLVDQFSQTLNFTPAKDYWSAKRHILSFLHYASLDLELRVWCSPGWYGDVCQHQCKEDNYHTCTTNQGRRLSQTCEPDTLILPLSGSVSSLYDHTALKTSLKSFLATVVCPRSTTNVSLQIVTVIQNSQQQTDVVFWATCGGSVVSRLRFEQVLYVLSHVTTSLGSPTQILGLPVVSKTYNIIQESNREVRLAFFVRLVEYYNPNAQGCDSRNTSNMQCNPRFQICLDGYSAACKNLTVVDGTSLTDCAGNLVDLSKSYPEAYPATSIIYLEKFPTLINVTITDFQGESLILQKIFDTDKLRVGTNFLDAFPTTFAVNGNVSLIVEVSGWCLNCFRGNQCETADQSCDRAITQITHDCHVDADCEGLSSCYNNTCVCQDGLIGPTCAVDINECDIGICEHSKDCVNTHGGYICYCEPGFTDRNCDADVDECSSSPCHGGGLCVNNYGSYACVCINGTVAVNCAYNFCEQNKCQHNSTCVSRDNDFMCKCSSGWDGLNCEKDINECTRDLPCQNGGTCTNNPGGYTCSCPNAFSGKHCEVDVDECTSSPCQNECTHVNNTCVNGGTCINHVGTYSCKCPDQWTGTDCEIDVNECQTKPGICLNGGRCKNLVGSYVCICDTGWTGKNCSANVDECLGGSDACVHGSCIDTQGSYICECVQGYTGKNCTHDVDECSKYAPCQHGGTCRNNIGGYACECLKSWTGKNCTDDVDECSQYQPCRNHGTCVNLNGSYSCTCLSGWEGENCNTDINECQQNHCLHNGTCRNLNGSFTCDCKSGWKGIRCDIDINECVGDACKNGECPNVAFRMTPVTCDKEINECAAATCLTDAHCIDHIEVFSLQFTRAISPEERPQVQQGIRDILKLLTCRDSNSIFVSLIQNSVNKPDTVQFHAKCDGHHLTNNEINDAIRTLSTSRLAEIFPANLASRQTHHIKSWLSTHFPIVAGAVGGSLCVVILIVIAVCRVKRHTLATVGYRQDLKIIEMQPDMDKHSNSYSS